MNGSELEVKTQNEHSRILVVNKNIDTVKSIIMVMDYFMTEQRKYDFQFADTIKEGKELLGNHNLVISGIGHQIHALGNGWDGDGFEFLKYVKEKGFKSIIITGYGDVYRQKAMSLGADGYIPLGVHDIVKVFKSEIDRVLGKAA